MSKEPRIRRSAGMLGNPREARERAISATRPEPKTDPVMPEASSASRHPKPKVLMGEVAAPVQKYASGGAEHFGQQRYLLRSFMQTRGLRPSDWARAAGIPSGELLGFLTGRSRSISRPSLEKLAAAARCRVEDFFQ